MLHNSPDRSPALSGLILLAAGIGSASYLPAHLPWLVLSGGALLVVCASLVRPSGVVTAHRRSLLRAASAWTLSGMVLALGAKDHEAVHLPCGGLSVIVVGSLADAPTPAAAGYRFPLRPERIISAGDSVAVDGLIAVTLLLGRGDHALESPRYGARLCLKGLLTRVPGVRNPGEFNLEQYYAASDLRALLLVRGADACRVLPGDQGDWFFSHVVIPLRTRIVDYIDHSIGGDEGEFLKGLVLGIRTGMTSEVREAFVNAGVAHILAVSGSNVAVIAGFLYGVFLLLRLPSLVRDLLVASGILLYMVLTGSQPPVVRATIMALVVMAGRRLERPVSGVNSLGVSGVIILVLHPVQLFDVGFQLSFSAVLAIVVLYDRAARVFHGISARSVVGRGLRNILALIAVSLVATIGTLPLTALYFERVSIIGLAANIVVVPVAGLSVILGLAGLVADFLALWAGEAYASLNVILLHWTLAFTVLAGSSSFAVLHTSGWSLWSALGVGAALLCLLFLGSPRAGRMLIAALTFWNLSLVVPSAHVPPLDRETMRVVFVDVGQGDCALIQLPGGDAFAVDLGDRTPRLDQGRRTIMPLLARLGVEKLESVFLTHPHRDHIGGYPSIAAGIEVRRTYGSVAGQWPGRWRVDRLGAGEYLTLGSGARLYVLWPARGVLRQMARGNNGSLVMRLQYGRIALLLTGDIEAPVEKVLVSTYGELVRCDVLKVPHHGGAGGCTEDLLTLARPAHAVISVGSGNRFSHPSAAVVRRLSESGARLWRTDCAGAVIFETNGQTIAPMMWNRGVASRTASRQP